MEGEVIMKTHITDAWIPSVIALLASIIVAIVFGLWENTATAIEVAVVFSLFTAVPISSWAVVVIYSSQVRYQAKANRRVSTVYNLVFSDVFVGMHNCLWSTCFL